MRGGGELRLRDNRKGSCTPSNEGNQKATNTCFQLTLSFQTSVIMALMVM